MFFMDVESTSVNLTSEGLMFWAEGILHRVIGHRAQGVVESANRRSQMSCKLAQIGLLLVSLVEEITFSWGPC